VPTKSVMMTAVFMAQSIVTYPTPPGLPGQPDGVPDASSSR
jgi:hypothetical protein